MFKGLKKKFVSNRTGARHRGSSGGGQGTNPSCREPPDRGGCKPTSPRQIHPVDDVPPVPYARRSLERQGLETSRGKTPPIKTEGFSSPNTTSNNHQIPMMAYPISPNICVTGGKIEFINPSDSISDASDRSSLAFSPTSPSSPPPVKKDLLPSPTANINSKVDKSISKSPIRAPHKVAPESNIQKSPLKHSPDKKKSPNFDVVSQKRKNCNQSFTGGSLNLKNNQENWRVRRSATMPEREETKRELDLLRKENRYVKYQLATLKAKCSRLETQTESLEKEKKELQSQIENQADCEEKLSQYQSLVERCSALEYANAQLQSEAQVERQQYEKCLDHVASQVVQALLMQKAQQEKYQRLTKQVERLQKENENLCCLMEAKGGGRVSLSLNHPRKRFHARSLVHSKVSSSSHSLPNTLSRSEGPLMECKTEGSSSALNVIQPGTCIKENIIPSSNTSSSCNNTHSFHNPSIDTSTSPNSPCWYDIIKRLKHGESVSHSLPLETVERCDIDNNISSDSSADVEDQSSSILNGNFCTNSSEEEYNMSSLIKIENSFHADLSLPSNNMRVDCSNSPNVASHCSYQSRKEVTESPSFASLSSNTKNVVVNCGIINYDVKTDDSTSKMAVQSSVPSEQRTVRTVSFETSALSPSRSHIKENGDGASVSEVIIKDEGYSTMSSDVQAEAKDSSSINKIFTVVEEKIRNAEEEIVEESDSFTPVPTNIEISNNAKNLSHGVTSVCNTITRQTDEYCDGLRVVYDDEDNNSDIFFIPISEEKAARHSFNIPPTSEPLNLFRSFSDSFLYKLRNLNTDEKHFKADNLQQATLPSISSLKKYLNYNLNGNLKKVIRRNSMKSWRLSNKPFLQLSKASNSEREIMPKKCDSLTFSNEFCLHILSPSYSHAEMEDWSLDLSAEDIATLPETDRSAADSTVPILHESQPSIQETTLDLEEDTSEFLWNGATYFKAQEHELGWHYEKDNTKSWDLNLVSKNPSRSMISPKSGCSDQPAIWSSSDQLSCCSDIASKCSTDIENFCDQLCNLPELKRVSFGSSENGAPESVNSLSKLSEAESIEDNSEVIEDIAIDTVFTRDFYRLVKFESTKSLTASSKSLAMSEGLLTMDKLHGFESGQSNKTLASVLGFIAEQQQYCKDREALDEKSLSLARNIVNNCENSDLSDLEMEIVPRLKSKNVAINNNKGESKCNLNEEKLLSSSESLSCLNLDSERTSENPSEDEIIAPLMPKRSTSLNLGRERRYQRQRRPLPPVPADEISPPTLPSRVSSQSFSKNSNAACLLKSKEDALLPPPPTYEELYNEACNDLPPTIPPHGLKAPCLPKRSSSVHQEFNAWQSPPVPKRITSRALPIPPSEKASTLAYPPITSSSISNHTSFSLNNKSECAQNKRPRSLLKEATLANAVAVTQNRSSCGELGSACRSSATLLLELQKMAKAEEEEEKEKKSFKLPSHSLEATSPKQEVGLGTGWVRVEPLTDLSDPQTRASLLDSMMHSSEGGSSETDDEISKQIQQKHFLKALQKNKRKKKVLHPNSFRNQCLNSHPYRPSILDSQSLFHRFGDKETEVLKEFQFLETAFDGCYNVPDYSYPSDRKSSPYQINRTNPSSSRFCESQDDAASYEYNLPHCCEISSVPSPNINAPLCSRNDSNLSTFSVANESSSTERLVAKEFSWLQKYNALPDRVNPVKVSSSCLNVPSDRPSNHEASTNSSDSLSTTIRNTDQVKNSPYPLSTSNGRLTFKTGLITGKRHHEGGRSDAGVDRSNLCNVKAAIQKFNCPQKNESKPASFIDSKCRSNPPYSLVNKPKEEYSRFVSKDKIEIGNSKNVSESFKSTKPDKSFLARAPLKQRNERPLISQSGDSVKKKKSTLPPKADGGSFCSRSKNTSKKGSRRLKSRSKREPLDLVLEIGDSASSEGSDRGTGGRLSISDSCAELLSPFESGDEVFQKTYNYL